jgi:hypothetical protein
MHSLSTIDEVFGAVTVATRNLRPLLPDLGNFVGTLAASIKDVYIAHDTAVVEAELQAALRSALAFLEKVHADAGPLLFFLRGSLGYELAVVVRGLRNAASKAHAAGLSARDPTFDADFTHIIIQWLKRIEAQHDETAHLFAAYGGNLTAMLAACQHQPLTASLLRGTAGGGPSRPCTPTVNGCRCVSAPVRAALRRRGHRHERCHEERACLSKARLVTFTRNAISACPLP